MKCMKCGREVEDHLFCEECQEGMKKYPVKPGIAIQLPRREETGTTKKTAPKRRMPTTPEEKLKAAKRRLRVMTVLWLITLALLAATIYPAVEFIRDIDIPLPGQNYTIIEGWNNP